VRTSISGPEPAILAEKALSKIKRRLLVIFPVIRS
jgi:hypothetical protein